MTYKLDVDVTLFGRTYDHRCSGLRGCPHILFDAGSYEQDRPLWALQVVVPVVSNVRLEEEK